MNRPRLFVSYSHHPVQQKQAADIFLQWLREIDGLEIHTDEEVETPQGPPEGWTAWMRGQIENADWVIVICSQGYRESWEKKPSGGRGATFEAALLMQELYEQRMINRKLIPVILRPEDTNAIPRELRDSTHYLIPQQQDLMVHRILKGTWLGRFIEGFAAAEPGTVTDDLTPAEILNGAMELDKDAAELPGFAVLQKALIAEANEFVLQISNSKEAMEVEKVRLGFRRSFCPRAKQLFELAGNLPTVLKRVYEESCLR